MIDMEREYNMFFLRVCVAIVLAIFIFVGGYQYGLSKFDTELKVDTLHVTDTVWKSYPVLVKSDPVLVMAPVDTDAIVQAYYTQNIFHDTLRLKEYGTITLIDTVYQNSIGGRQYSYDLNIPTFTAVKRTKFDVGVGAFMQRDSYGLLGSLKVRHVLFSGGYDFRNNTPCIGVQYMFGK